MIVVGSAVEIKFTNENVFFIVSYISLCRTKIPSQATVEIHSRRLCQCCESSSSSSSFGFSLFGVATAR